MKRHIIGLVIFSLIATAWGQQDCVDGEAAMQSGEREQELARPNLDTNDSRNGAAHTLGERRRLRRERGKTNQAKTPEQKTELDFLRDAIKEFKDIYCSDGLSNQGNSGKRHLRKLWSEPTSWEVSALEKHGFSNAVCVLAFDYLTCTQKVEEAQKDLVDYELNETSLAQLTAEEIDFYQSQVSNRIARLEELQMAFEKVDEKMTTNFFEVVSFARDIRNEFKRKRKQSFDDRERVNAMRNKISFLRKKQNAPKLIAEDEKGLNVSNLVIHQVCSEVCSDGANSFIRSPFRIFSYSLTITDGRITKIEELPSEEGLRVEPVTPIVLEKNK